MGSRYKTVGNMVVSETNFKLYVLTKRKSYSCISNNIILILIYP